MTRIFNIESQVSLGFNARIEFARAEMLDIPASITDTAMLRQWLDERNSADGALLEKSVRLAVNSEIVVDPHPVSDRDEIAFLPPVGGG